MIAGYLTGVAVALIAFTIAFSIRLGVAPSGVELGIFLVEFVVLIVMHWLAALAPFLLLRKFGGFDNVWFSTLVGGVLLAFVVLPFPVGLYVMVENIEGSLSYFPTLGRVAETYWPFIVMSGVLGGLTYAGVKRVFDRLASRP